MSNATEPKTEASDIIEHFWPEHLSGKEVKTKWPKGRNATIVKVEMGSVFDQQINETKEMPIVFFEGISRGLVCNKTNGRMLIELFGKTDTDWVGQEVSIAAAKRSNGTLGVDIEKPEEE